jgi:alkylhydroperoxidase family enzyme
LTLGVLAVPLNGSVQPSWPPSKPGAALSRIRLLERGDTELEQVWNLRAPYFELFTSEYEKALRKVDPVLIELCRLRIAQMVESEFDLGLRYLPAQLAGLDEAKVADLPDYPTSARFNDTERAVLEFVEQWVIQSSSIDDDQVARVSAAISPESLLYLCKAVGVIDQFSRANSALRIAAPTQAPGQLPSFTVSRKA